MKYEIRELLALRGNGAIDQDKFSTQAIDNNLVKEQIPKSFVLKERPINRAHLRSKTPLLSTRYASGSNSDRASQPQRQPGQPPNGRLAQTNAGFAKFLKEHSSPKHQRVTAGGKIVPMRAASPIPEFKPSKSSNIITSRNNSDMLLLVDNNDEGQETVCKDSRSQDSLYSSESSNEEGHQRRDRKANIHRQHGLQQSLFEPSNEPLVNRFPTRNKLCQQYNEVSSTVPSYYVAREMAPWVGDPNASLCNPAYANLSTMQTNMPPSVTGTSFPFAVHQDKIRAARASTGISEAVSANPATAFRGVAQTMLPSFPEQALLPTAYLQLCNSTEKSLQEVSSEFEALTMELAALDRYMAMHTFDLNSQIKQVLVEQRMNLVKDLDITRKYKEHLEANWTQQQAGVGLSPTFAMPNWQPHVNQGVLTFGSHLSGIPPCPSTFQSFSDGQPHITFTNPVITNVTASEISPCGELLGVAQFPPFPLSATLDHANPLWGYGNFQSFVDPALIAHANTSQAYTTQQSVSTLHPQVPVRAETDSLRTQGRTCQNTEEVQSQNIGLAWVGKPEKNTLEMAKKSSNILRVPGCKYCEPHFEQQSNQTDVPPKSNERTTNRRCLKKLLSKHQRKRNAGVSTDDCFNKVEVSAIEQALSDSDISSSNSWATLCQIDSRDIAKRSRKPQTKTAKHGRHRRGVKSKVLHDIEETQLPSNADAVTPPLSKGKPSPALTGLYELRNRHSILGTPRRSQPLIFRSWSARQGDGLIMKAAGKVCSPVVSRVTASGLPPSFDGTADIKESPEPHTQKNLGQGNVESCVRASQHPWYKRPPLERPNPAEVEALFERLKRETGKMMSGYGTMNG